MSKVLRIGTRDSQLAVWQAAWVQRLLKASGTDSELVYIKSEGDLDTITPLYALGVQGVFTKALDAALLNDRIDLAVHSMKDVPTTLARGIGQAAVLERASYKDIFVYRQASDLSPIGYENGTWTGNHSNTDFTIATGSVRRIAQWRHRYPAHRIENLRGNVNTRLRKLEEQGWNGAIFAAAGLERIHVRPTNSVDLDWMLPAPAQGAVMIVARERDDLAMMACAPLNHDATELCTRIEREFLSTLHGGCSTPISALAVIEEGQVSLQGNIVRPDGSELVSVAMRTPLADAATLGVIAAKDLLLRGGQEIVNAIRQKGLSSDEAV